MYNSIIWVEIQLAKYDWKNYKSHIDMNTNNTYVIIMAGGVGSRFWPYSRKAHPKQFLDVLGVGKSLLQLTYHRFIKLCPKENIYIVSNDLYYALIKDQLPDLTDDQILLEPNQRNTAPCIAYASYKIASKNPEAITVVTPADHAVFMEDEFVQTCETAVDFVEADNQLITIGIKPSRPETGYGYIQFKESEGPVKKVKTFTEKPQLELAKAFFESGDFVWNAGIFIWKVKSIISSFEKFLPEIAETFSAISGQYYTVDEKDKIAWAYARTKSISIDYGVMEKADNVHVVLGDFGWSDLGSWSSLHEYHDKDSNGNVVDGNAMLYESSECIIRSPGEKLVVVQGLEGYLVADCDDVLMICNKDDEKKIRSIVNDIKSEKGEHYI
jgi:mannose-1-phosphate guanylyltransferase